MSPSAEDREKRQPKRAPLTAYLPHKEVRHSQLASTYIGRRLKELTPLLRYVSQAALNDAPGAYSLALPKHHVGLRIRLQRSA